MTLPDYVATFSYLTRRIFFLLQLALLITAPIKLFSYFPGIAQPSPNELVYKRFIPPEALVHKWNHIISPTQERSLLLAKPLRQRRTDPLLVTRPKTNP